MEKGIQKLPNAKEVEKEISDFLEQGIKDGKILPAWKEKGIEEFMLNLDESEESYEFSEGKKETRSEWFRSFISDFASHPLFKEMAKPKDDDKGGDADFAEDEKEAEEMAAAHRYDAE